MLQACRLMHEGVWRVERVLEALMIMVSGVSMRWAGVLISGLLAVLGTGCASLNASFAPPMIVHVGRPFRIAESSEAYGWGVLSHPRIIRLSRTNIIVRYYVGGDTAEQDDAKGRSLSGLSPALSRDGGRTWVFGEQQLDTELARASRYWGADVGVGEGAVLIYEGVRGVRLGGEAVLDGPWSVAYETNGFAAGWPWHRGVSMADGALLAVSNADEYHWRGQAKYRFHLMKSADTGRTWEVVSRVAGPDDALWAHQEWPLGFEGPCESAIAVTRKGEIVCVSRVGLKRFTFYEAPKTAVSMLQSRSSDGGRTWNHKRMAFEGVYPKLYRMRNGLLVLAYGRPGNNLVFSANGGRIWTAETALTPPNAKTSGYCDVVETSPGRLLVVFDVHDTDLRGFWLWEPKLANGLYGVFVDVKTLW